MKRLTVGALALLTASLLCGAAIAGEFITVASTTSTKGSGLYDHLLPLFQDRAGIEVRVVAVGTGKAIRMAEAGDADVLLVHNKTREQKFVDAGFGLARNDLMYNDFIIVGPSDDPAGIRSEAEAAAALAKIADTRAVFLSRGDDSGTHAAERRLWQAAGRDPTGQSGDWYRETGSGMGATLNTAVAMNGYLLVDRATWSKSRNKGALEILVQGDAALFNQYGVIIVNPERHPHVKLEPARRFVDWLLSPAGQAAIAAYRIDGQQQFFPNARPTDG